MEEVEDGFVEDFTIKLNKAPVVSKRKALALQNDILNLEKIIKVKKQSIKKMLVPANKKENEPDDKEARILNEWIGFCCERLKTLKKRVNFKVKNVIPEIRMLEKKELDVGNIEKTLVFVLENFKRATSRFYQDSVQTGFNLRLIKMCLIEYSRELSFSSVMKEQNFSISTANRLISLAELCESYPVFNFLEDVEPSFIYRIETPHTLQYYLDTEVKESERLFWKTIPEDTDIDPAMADLNARISVISMET